MIEIIEFPTGGYGIQKSKKPLVLFSFSENKFIDFSDLELCLITDDFKEQDFSYTIACIRELNRNFIDPVGEQNEPF